MKIITILTFIIFFNFILTQAQENIVESDIHQEHDNPVFQNQVDPGEFQLPEDHINQQYLDQVQNEAFEAQVQPQLSTWVTEELKQTKTTEDFQKVESFMVNLQSDDYFEFRWKLTVPHSKKRQFKLLVSVFTYEYGDDLALATNPQQDQYVEIDTKNNIQDSYSSLGKLYVEKKFNVYFESQFKLFRVLNKNQRDVIVQIDMQIEQQELSITTADALKNEHFSLPAQKLQTIFRQFQQNDKSRTKMSKWQWGFLERQERYDSEMLKLTGVQLLVIIVTAIVQMFCIKNALDKKQII